MAKIKLNPYSRHESKYLKVSDEVLINCCQDPSMKMAEAMDLKKNCNIEIKSKYM